MIKSKSIGWYKFKRVIEFLSLLNVEPYVFFIMFVFTLKRVPSDQLVQDKICLIKYNGTDGYCLGLSQLKPEDDTLHKKSLILGDLTKFSLYTSIITTVPTVFAALMMGSWIDKYQGGKKALMITAAVAGMVEALICIANVYFYDKSEMYFLLTTVPSFLTGGLTGVFTAFWSYIASTTPVKYRGMRMLVAEVSIFAAMPLGTLLGGKILNTKPILKHGQLHNYTLVFIIQFAAYLFALIWAILRVNEKRDIKEFHQRFDNTADIELQTKASAVSQQQKQIDDNKHIHPLKLLFQFENVKDMLRTCCKPRPNKVRLQIWLLFITMICYLMVHIGPGVFLYPFVQKVYRWNSEVYSNAAAIGNVINAVSSLIMAPIFIKIIKVKDTTLSIIGLGSYFIQNIIRALVLTPIGFYVSLVAGAMGSVAAVGIRTHFSKIVEPQELGKVFGLMSAIDSVAPLLGSAIFANMFNATMDTMPGISFIITAAIIIPAILINIWIDLWTVLPDLANKNHNNNKTDNNLTIGDYDITDMTKM